MGIILRGDSGIGKDTLINILEKIMGNEYFHRTADVSDIFPKDSGFNSHLKDKLIIELNEVEGRNTIDIKERIKDFITAEYNNINGKYVKLYKQKNYCVLFFLSNNISPMIIPYNDRRLILIKCGTYHKKDNDFWKDFYDNYINSTVQLNGTGTWINNLYNELMDVDLSDFNYKERPLTNAYSQLQKSNLSTVIKYIQFLMDNINTNCMKFRIHISEDDEFSNYDINKWKFYKDNYFIQPRQLYKQYTNWCLKENLMTANKVANFNSNHFKKQIREINGIEEPSKKILLPENKYSLRYFMFEPKLIIEDMEKNYHYKTANDESSDSSDYSSDSDDSSDSDSD